MILDDARETTRQTFEFLFDTASAEQHELLVALERYVDMLHNIIDDRQQVGDITGLGRSTESGWIRQLK